MKAINEHVGWGVDANEKRALFCSNCREVFYETHNGYKIIQAKWVFGKMHKCPQPKLEVFIS